MKRFIDREKGKGEGNEGNKMFYFMRHIYLFINYCLYIFIYMLCVPDESKSKTIWNIEGRKETIWGV